ncbi:MAG: hypothetical protein IPN73_20080 [Saprospiraceae bacterium]|nr:hypothetical protein [Saprospiraceae bacterium]
MKLRPTGTELQGRLCLCAAHDLPFDIGAIARGIHDLDAKMAQTGHIIAGFCKELGI